MEGIGILAKRRIPDVKSKGGIDTLCLAERPQSNHPPPEVARSPIYGRVRFRRPPLVDELWQCFTVDRERPRLLERNRLSNI